jgi:hypothetical protein
MKIKLISSAFRVFIVFIFFSHTSFSANRFWVGTGFGNWNNISNWSNSSGGASGFSVPGVADIAIFDAGNISNCIIDANVNINGFTIGAPYTGLISSNIGITIIIAASGFSQSGGTFTGNNGNITINGAFSLSGGAFISTSGTLQITSGYNFSGGTFNHNNGTTSFSSLQTISGNTIFYNILFVANGGIYTIAPGTTISSINNVTINGAGSCIINTGTVEIMGDLTLINTANFSLNGGTTTFLFDGTGIQNINSSIVTIILGTNEKICALPNVEINKTSGSLNLNGVINISGASWKTTAGNLLISPGTSTLNILSNITFSGQNLTLSTIHINANGQIITLNPASYTLTAASNLIINGGGYYQVNTGVLEILGDLNLISTSTSAFNGGNGTFLFDGSGIQNINSVVNNLNFVCSLPNIQINKTLGTLNLIGLINFNGSSWNTVAGSLLVNAGTSTVNILKTTVLSGQNLSLYDIVITGNFSFITIVAGVVWSSTHLITLAGGTSWYQINTGTLNAKGDVLVTNTNASFNVGGNAILLFDGAANQLLTGSGISFAGRLPQVEINKTGGTLTLSNSIISTDNNWNYIAGNVDAVTNSSTVDFYRNSTIDGQGTSTTMAFFNVIFSGLISLGGNMDVNGDFTIRSGLTNKLDVTAANNYQLNIAGNWSNYNSITPTSFNQQSGKVIFDGASAQSLMLSANTDIETFYKLEMNNTNTGLTLNAPVTISNNLNFILGNIISSITNSLLLNNNVTSTGANNTSFVSGPISKTGNQAFIFPVGKNSVYAPIAISAPSLNTDRFTTEYFQLDPNPTYNVSLKDPSLNHISRCEYWILDRVLGTSNVTVTLSWDARSCGVTNLSDLRVARWDGLQWKDHGNGGTIGNLVSGTINSFTTVTAFSPFTLSSNTINNPLPLELITFKGQCENQNIVLKWRTATETNNNYFTIENSSDGIIWDIIGETKGAGNSSVFCDYTYITNKNTFGISYFRLKQTDFNGNYKYNPIISVENCAEIYSSLVIYPNPAKGVFNLTFGGNEPSVTSIEVSNSVGEIVYKSDSFKSVIDLSNNVDGIYLIQLKLYSEVVTKKLYLKKD